MCQRCAANMYHPGSRLWGGVAPRGRVSSFPGRAVASSGRAADLAGPGDAGTPPTPERFVGRAVPRPGQPTGHRCGTRNQGKSPQVPASRCVGVWCGSPTRYGGFDQRPPLRRKRRPPPAPCSLALIERCPRTSLLCSTHGCSSLQTGPRLLVKIVEPWYITSVPSVEASSKKMGLRK